MNVIKLALLNKLAREVEETKEIRTAVNGTDEISICYSGNRIYLDREILEYARKHYDKKLADLEKAFEEA